MIELLELVLTTLGSVFRSRKRLILEKSLRSCEVLVGSAAYAEMPALPTAAY